MTKVIKKLQRTAALTDIHWGTKSNSEQHNQDCDTYIDWFCDQVRNDPVIDNIVFMGDWFENRAALNVMTLNYSYRGAKKLNDLGLPVYFIIGNHDLYHRNTRELYSTVNFAEFNNFVIINEPTIIDELGENGSLLCPYMFHHEYPSLEKYLNLKTWWGHFEFKGFVITGYNITMLTGPDADRFVGPDYIFSGHFHKRQLSKNVAYIGNVFPTSFSDANDFERGMCVYDYKNKTPTFIDWKDCPKYVKCKLSDILSGLIDLPQQSRVSCVVDVPITYEESLALKQELVAANNLRELILTESRAIAESITDTIVDGENPSTIEASDEHSSASIDELVVHMLGSIDNNMINNQILIEEYIKLQY